MKISEVNIGDKFIHPKKGEGVVTGKTKKTITITFKMSTVKVTYITQNFEFSIFDF